MRRISSGVAATIVLCAALVLGVYVVPASALVTSASGTTTCPNGKQPYVRVTLVYSGSVDFYQGSKLKGTSGGGYEHILRFPYVDPGSQRGMTGVS